MKTLLSVVAATVASICPAALHAQDGVELSANAGIVSDYRFRGVSLSDRNPAVQGGLDLEAGPLFVGAWGSTIADYEGANVELDVYGGLQGSLGEAAWSAGAYAYLYPGGVDVNYIELVATAEQTFGSTTLGLEAALAPRQDNVAEANRYFGVSASVELGMGWSVNARGGHEDGFYDSKWDWELGARYSLGSLTASLAYVDTDHGAADEAGRLAKAGLVASLLAEF